MSSRVLEEKWKTIKDFPNYEISNMGKCRNKNKKFLQGTQVKSGYLKYGLGYNNRKKSAHRLVALAFLPNPNNYNSVDHIDRNKLNNNVDNLRWANPKMQRANRNAQSTNGHYKKIWRISIKTDEKLQLYNSLKEAIEWCRDKGLCKSSKKTPGVGNIVGVAKGRLKHRYGYKWEYHNEYDNEIWTEIPYKIVGKKGYYISKNGYIKTSGTNTTITKGSKKDGYLRVHIANKHFYVHRLMAIVFLPNQHNKKQVNHKDNDGQNNKLTNLEWVTRRENMRHLFDNNYHSSARQIKVKLPNGNIIEYNSVMQAVRELKICSKYTIYRRLKDNKEYKGYQFIEIK